MKKQKMAAQESSFLLYTTSGGKEKIEVRLEKKTVWLTQAAMAELFQTTPQNITIHLKETYAEGELSESATCKENLQVQKEGVREVNRVRKFYNLEAILEWATVSVLIAVRNSANGQQSGSMNIW